ncbi:MAG: cytochrome C [Magnetococcales bacterium]|nr:cytochrome C [Magnetococcales bacterium]
MKRHLFLLLLFCWGVVWMPAALLARDELVDAMEAMEPFKVTQETSNDKCLYCHEVKGFSVLKSPGQKRQNLHVEMATLTKSVHNRQLCVECHQDISRVPHEEGSRRRVDCIRCHTDMQKKSERGSGKSGTSLHRVAESITRYMDSVHAKPRRNDPSRANAYCSDCHGGHAIYSKTSAEQKEFYIRSPLVCGGCHPKQLQVYENSLHGSAVLRWGDEKKPVCADCHTTHQIGLSRSTDAQLIVAESCGDCHKQEYASYAATYHGQVTTLGYVNTAKCFDCHESHDNKRVTDPTSKTHKNNRDKTCKVCHANVSPGFLTFQPHGNTHDFQKYPEMWLASKGMLALLVGVFALFWTHSLLWFLRERKEKQRGEHHVLPKEVLEAPPPATGSRVNVQRFPALWRLAHLCFALSIMVLGFTGLTVLFANAFWAQSMARFLGGAEAMAVAHRVAGVVFVGVFCIHLVAVLHKLLIKNRKTFQWFGPHSLLPRWQDLWDLIAMLKWFAGKGARPHLDHWTYWEKFDYWAPFWGVAIIGGSGLVLWFPAKAGEYLPGWIFNVATIFHGEEALLAIVFLFSVHFFNGHFRPSKFPLDIIMFVGNMPLEEFKKERTVEYQRAVREGKLETMMVEPPSRRAQRYSRILGFTLLGTGLTLLFLALSGVLTEIIHLFL